MASERDQELMEAGSQATLIAGIVRPYVDELWRVKVTHMISIYRQGKIDHDLLIGKVAEIAALEELLSNLESAQRRAETAIEREFKRGT